MSDRFASALWAVSFLASASMAGAQAVYFHGGPGGPYAAIAYDDVSTSPGVPDVRPMYYGLYAFAHLITDGGQWIPNTTVIQKTFTGTSDTQTQDFVTANDPTHADPECENGVLAGPVCCAASCGICGGTGCNDRPGGSESCCAGTIQAKNQSCDDHVAPCVVDREYAPVVEAFSLVVNGVSNDRTTTEMRTLVVAKSSTQAAKGVTEGTVQVVVCPHKLEESTESKLSGLATKGASNQVG